MKAFWPFIRAAERHRAGRSSNLLGLRSRGGHAMVHSEEELKMLVTASQEAGVLEEQEEQMLHRVFGFADLTAGQVMVPRTELVAVAGRRVARRRWSTQIARGRLHRACRSTATTSTTSSASCTSTDLLQALASRRRRRRTPARSRAKR